MLYFKIICLKSFIIKFFNGQQPLKNEPVTAMTAVNRSVRYNAYTPGVFRLRDNNAHADIKAYQSAPSGFPLRRPKDAQ